MQSLFQIVFSGFSGVMLVLASCVLAAPLWSMLVAAACVVSAWVLLRCDSRLSGAVAGSCLGGGREAGHSEVDRS